MRVVQRLGAVAVDNQDRCVEITILLLPISFYLVQHPDLGRTSKFTKPGSFNEGGYIECPTLDGKMLSTGYSL
jgi:hypothetical protein